MRASLWLSFLVLVSLPAYSTDFLVRLKEKTPMTSLAKNVMDPSSPRFGKFYTPDEIKNLVGPSDSDFNALIQDMKTRGFTIVGNDYPRLFLTVRLLPKSPSNPPITISAFSSLDNDLIESISAPDENLKLHPLWRPVADPKAAPFGALSPQAVHGLYGFDQVFAKGITGKGQHIAIATYNDANVQDVNDYFVKMGITPGPVVDKVQFNGTPVLNPESAVESEVDAEFSGHMAPGAQIHIFTSAQNNDVGEVQLFNAILDDNRAKIVNYSWGDCELSLSALHKTDMDKVFSRAVAQGVNIFVASGDDGATGCSKLNIIAADWPADNPYVVSVGGTTIGGHGTTPNETAWSNSGGGVSEVYDAPFWQKNIAAVVGKRGIPDVSFNADPQSGQVAWVSYHKQPTDPLTQMWIGIGGTSIASPQWAGFLALVNEARGVLGAQGGKGPIGYINPIIYSVSSNLMPSLFNDVTSGQNNGFLAGPGWDPITGLGSMKADTLLPYLANSP